MLFRILKTPVSSTLQTAYAETNLFTPVAFALNYFSTKVDSKLAKKAFAAGTYPGFVVDSLVQSAAIFAFTFETHLRDIVASFKKGDIKWGATKIALTPVTLIAKEVAVTALSVGYLFNALVHLFIPTATIANLCDLGNGQKYFEIRDEYKFTYSRRLGFSIKPIDFFATKTQRYRLVGQNDHINARLNSISKMKTRLSESTDSQAAELTEKLDSISQALTNLKGHDDNIHERMAEDTAFKRNIKKYTDLEVPNIELLDCSKQDGETDTNKRDISIINLWINSAKQEYQWYQLHEDRKIKNLNTHNMERILTSNRAIPKPLEIATVVAFVSSFFHQQ